MTKKRDKDSYYLIINSSELNDNNWTAQHYAKKYPKRIRKLFN